MAKTQATLEQRFWQKVDRRGPDECWPWLATKNNHGYGMIWKPGEGRGRNKTLAHRVSYELANGSIPKQTNRTYHGSIVMHSCDNPGCVNPAHLAVGTMKTNHLDMVQKGRRRIGWNPTNLPPVLRGADHPGYGKKRPELSGEQNKASKLTDEQVSEIYRRFMAGEPSTKVAKAFGMDRSTVLDIRNGVRWAHRLGVDGNPTLAELRAVPMPLPPTKLTADQIPQIRALLAAGMMGTEVAARFGVHKATISEIKRGKIWAG